MSPSPKPSLVPIAVRAFAIPAAPPRRERPPSSRPARFRSVLVLDTESTTDPTQRLLFGSYRYYRLAPDSTPDCVEEGLFCADDLDGWRQEQFAVLREYVRSHRPEVASVALDSDANATLTLRTRREFVRSRFLPAARAEATAIVGFNLAFDLPRLAVDARAARGRFKGGFSLVLDEYENAAGERKSNPHKERVKTRNLDSKREFIELGSRWRSTDDGSRGLVSGRQGRALGNFLDLRTLDFALTNEAHSLERACELWNVEHPKQKAEQHGVITPEYIDYNRADVRATAELAWALLQEFYRHAS